MENQTEAQGKKVFFLCPTNDIRNDMLDVLIMAGYEAYSLNDEKKAQKLLEMFPGSIMFINIDAGLKEEGWETYIRTIQESPETKGTRIGVMSNNQDTELIDKYLKVLAVPCGYVQLKLGLMESTKTILSTLEANDARSRSGFRADCQDEVTAAVNYKENTGYIHGKILEIGSTGISARFNNMPNYPPNTLLHSVQLKLRGGIVMADMTIAGNSPDDENVKLMLFDSKISKANKLVIDRFIKQCLQKYIDKLTV